MKKYIMAKKNQLFLCMALLVIVICGLLLSILGKVSYQLSKTVYPESTLTTDSVSFDTEYQYIESLPVLVACPTLQYSIWLPENVKGDEEYLVASYGDIDVIVMESQKDIETMATNVLPHYLNCPVLGQGDGVETYCCDTGYYFEYPASYCACTVQTQVSIRTVTTYTLTYGLHLSDDTTLYIYVSSDSKDLLKGQKELLDKIAFSVREVGFGQNTSVTNNGSSNESGSGPIIMDVDDYVEKNTYLDENVLRIALEHEMDAAMENGVFLFEWMNSMTHPVEVNVFAPDGRELHLIEDYSYEGHYVYDVGECVGGTYIVEGYTTEQLTGVTMSVFERSFYRTEYLFEDVD